MSEQKFWISRECPNCGDSQLTWISDNGDGSIYDGQEWTCEGCHVQGYVCAFEDGSMDLLEYEHQEPEAP